MSTTITAPAPLVATGDIPICAVDDVPFGEGRSTAVGDRRIAVFNAESGYFAIDNDCPHQGGPLADGLLAEACVTCPLHGRRIDLATGRVQGRDESVRTYPVSVRDGVLWLRLAEDVPEAA